MTAATETVALTHDGARCYCTAAKIRSGLAPARGPPAP